MKKDHHLFFISVCLLGAASAIRFTHTAAPENEGHYFEHKENESHADI